MLVCSKCKGKNIQTKAWVDVNTKLYKEASEFDGIEDNWCEDCQLHVLFENEGGVKVPVEITPELVSQFMNWTLTSDCPWSGEDEDEWVNYMVANTEPDHNIDSKRLFEIYLEKYYNKKY